MLEDVRLCLRSQRLIGVKVRCVLDAVLREGQLELFTGEIVTAERNQAGAHAEQAVVDLNESRLTGLLVDEDLLDRAQLLAGLVVCGCVKQILNVLTHCFSKPFYIWSIWNWQTTALNITPICHKKWGTICYFVCAVTHHTDK